MMKRHIFWILALVSSIAWANGTLKDIKGDVKVDSNSAVVGGVVTAGSMVKTGLDSRATIRFDDGQMIVLGSNTEFKVRQYTYSKVDPASDNIVLDIFRGSLRAITGALGHRNPNKFALFTPTATAGIRGTDFLASVVDYVGQDGVTRQQSFFNVKGGEIEVSTKAGKVALGKGQAVLTTPSGAITPIPLESLPANMQAIANAEVLTGNVAGATTGGASGTGAAVGTGAVAGTAAVAVPVIAIAGAVAGVVAATSENSTVTGHHGTATHHGTTTHH